MSKPRKADKVLDVRTATDFDALFAQIGPRSTIETETQIGRKVRGQSWEILSVDAQRLTFTAKRGRSTRTFKGAATTRGCVLMSYTPSNLGDSVIRVAF